MRTADELKAAIDSLSRIHAVELPPDSTGGRTLFHKSNSDVALVSRVDGDGRVASQELFLFDDYLLWERSSGLKSGTASAAVVTDMMAKGVGRAPGVAFDADPAATAQRLQTAAGALASYAGDDRLLDHVKQLVTVAAEGKPFTSNVVVTRTEHALQVEALRKAAEESGRRELQRRSKAQKLVLTIFAVMMLLAFGSFAAWVLLL